MKTEQGKDSDIQVISEKLKHEEAKSDPKFIIHEEVLYYLSNPDDDPTLRLGNNSDNQYVVQQNVEASEDPMSLGEANNDEGSTSDPDDIPLSRLVRRAKRQRSDSSEEEDIPEFELRKKLKRREERLAELNSVIWV
ncbi:hypothetical protein PoB_002765500 [Plakobranchus ocellatus]|uniref:Uncharacterized protein n=1 Tax=Plakobranchus ocellatus TaxID=259542 RepID=A0AAV3ZZ66_9GAST|nr:hypothetical protein PoB_002765500 [Plakobranchus ocellatus]